MDNIFVTLIKRERKTVEDCLKQINATMKIEASLLQQSLEAKDNRGVINHISTLNKSNDDMLAIFHYVQNKYQTV